MPPNTRTSTKTLPIRPWAVALEITQTVNFVVDARTEQEAIQIAEDWLEDGESGTVADRDIISSDAWPTEDSELENPINRSLFPRRK